VLATDFDDTALKLVQIAARTSGYERLRTSHFDVLDCATVLPPSDLLVAADVMYSATLARGLARRCVEALDAGMRVVVADPGRPTRRDFQDELKKARIPSVECVFVEASAVGSFSAWARRDGPTILGLHLPPSSASECRQRVTRHAAVPDSQFDLLQGPNGG
jgi:hypothetical protein